MKLVCDFKYSLLDKNDFKIFKYKAKEPAALPNGKTTYDITAKGYCLPSAKKIMYELDGEFSEYVSKTTGKKSYTFEVRDAREVLPSKKEATVSYLASLKGIGKSLSERMYDKFRDRIFDIIENTPEKLSEVPGISKKKAIKVQEDFLVRNKGHELFMYLYRYGVSPGKIAKIYKMLGSDAINIISENPYVILDAGGIGFKTADEIAMRAKFPKNFMPRIEAGVLEVLLESEKGGEIFNKIYSMPGFLNQGYLRDELLGLLDKDSTFATGNVYLPRDILYILTLKLLEIELSESDFDDICFKLHQEKKIFISRDRNLPENDPERLKVYRYQSARAEFSAAKKIAELMECKLPKMDDLKNTIYDVEKNLGILLSDEQEKAVQKALESPVSIITGGPGTGKTSVQKVILKVFRAYDDSKITLCAPTGRAAKRMAESTGYPASTLHKALGLYSDFEEDESSVISSNNFQKGLIIVDETSMIGSFLLEKLVSHITKGSRLILIGDIDQLPSIETGAVLRELINSKVVPVTRLTKTYRQASGSSIITNAARIKFGEKRLEYNSGFEFSPDETSDDIARTVCSLVPRLISRYGENDVMVLTAYRRKTSSGANELNLALRDVLRKDITDKTNFYERQGIKIYEGDKVMNTRNTEYLTNGDIGKVVKIVKDDKMLSVTCEFDGQKVALEDEEALTLELAYATTVHKSQGSEAKAVVLVTDNAHKIMLKRNLFYTGVTRAKERIIICGQLSAMHRAIDTVDSVYRRSQLGRLLRDYSKKESEASKKGKIKKENPKDVQVQMEIK